MNKLYLLTLIGISAVSAAAQSGKITGKLTYPGDGIPSDLVVCVKSESLYAEPLYCSNDEASRLRKGNVVFNVRRRAASYEVSLPAGTYLVYATTREMPGVKAYYNDFIKCGMAVTCTSKKRIVVRVRKGQTTSGIKVGDFW